MSYNGPSMVERAGNIYTSSLPRIHSARGGTPKAQKPKTPRAASAGRAPGLRIGLASPINSGPTARGIVGPTLWG
jgi:hypothetical protein